MAKKRASSSAKRGVGQSATRGGRQAGTHQTGAQIRTQATPQPKVVNGGQPRVASEQVHEQVVQNTPPAPGAAPTIALPADVVTRLLNVLEALAPNHGGILGPPATSQAQAQVQLNVAANQTPQLAPQQVVQSIGQSKEFKNFMDLKPPEFDASPTSIEPQKFIDRCENILTTLGMKETRGVEFTTFLFSGSAESWWILIQRGRQAGLPPITWSKFLALLKDRFIPLSKQDEMRRHFNNLRQGTMTITEYEAKFTDLSRYVPSLVEDPREKVRRFVDGLEYRYRGPVVRDVRYGTYSDVVDTALHYESYLDMDKVERESKKSCNTGGFSGAPSGGKSGFYCGQSRPTQSESVV
ncbi:uncharacterized protein LOC132644194 [Lycium barbarum]|uniref:uncharacterized protein LOC132644194 n=1 Tax=Lycium barbarum TaxID=112863 RepID=UPI00293E8206|nr:uncharacterized protein LOC132644194 [Lycium barbarum]